MSDLYTKLSYEVNELITKRYSSSFSLSSTLFAPSIRKHIYAIYGLVRIADEIVDTYRGPDALKLLDELEADTIRAMTTGYSTNPVVNAYAATARKFDIDIRHLNAFFQSMRADLSPSTYTRETYDSYIYGSAEVVGLMCLHVFVNGDAAMYTRLEDGARALGAAYQKINFLRDLAADADELGRWYFPNTSYDSFGDGDKVVVTKEIRHDIERADLALKKLPNSSRSAVALSLAYYSELLTRLERVSVEDLKSQRLRVPTIQKLLLYLKARVAL